MIVTPALSGVVLGLCLGIASASAQTTASEKTQTAPADATMRLREIGAARAGQQKEGQMRPTVENNLERPSPAQIKQFGSHADLHTYPASIFSDTTACSATLIGPQAILTAAHCTEGDDHIYFTYSKKDFSALCRRFTGWEPETGAGDWALCAVEQPGGVAGIVYETLNREPALIQKEAEVLLTGFGLTTAEGKAGTFSIGAAKVTAVPTKSSDEIVTQGATTLPGDSGSAMFMVIAGSSRRIIGVNANKTDNDQRTSSASSISTPPAIEFVTIWMSQHPGFAVCGYTSGATTCQP